MEYPPVDVEGLLEDYHSDEEAKQALDWIVDNTPDDHDFSIVDDGEVMFFPVERFRILKEAIRNERMRGN